MKCRAHLRIERFPKYMHRQSLPDPRLELHDANDALLVSNDNWQSNAGQAALITSYGLAPPNNLESAVAISLPHGRYTAIVTGKNNQTGIGLIEIYDER